MIEFDFIPTFRRQVQRRRRRVQRWTNASMAYVGFVVIGSIMLLAAGRGDGGRAVDEELSRTAHRIREASEQVAAMREQVSEAEQALAASRRVGVQPDWSVLLAVLADATGETIVLRRCRVAPARGSRGRPDAPAADTAGFDVIVGGYGRTQQDVSRFVLRLEETGLFQSVTLSGTRREPFLSGRAFAFEIACTLAGVEEGRDG